MVQKKILIVGFMSYSIIFPGSGFKGFYDFRLSQVQNPETQEKLPAQPAANQVVAMRNVLIRFAEKNKGAEGVDDQAWRKRGQALYDINIIQKWLYSIGGMKVLKEQEGQTTEREKRKEMKKR